MTGIDTEMGCVQIGVDFGESLTVIAVSGPTGDCHTIEFPHISHEYPAVSGNRTVYGIPTLLHYRDGVPDLTGEEVARCGATETPATARWMRRYLCDQSPVRIFGGNGRMVRYEDAAIDFLTGILTGVIRQYPGAGLVFTSPSDAPAAYPDLLQRIARGAGASTCSTIPEYLAAAAGYGYVPVPREPFLVVSFGETDCEIAVIVMDPQATKHDTGGIRVIARTSSSAGCRALDSWIVQDLLVKFRMLESDPRALRLSPYLHYEAAHLREQLPIAGEQQVTLTDPVSGRMFSTAYTLKDLERVIMDHDIPGSLQYGISRVLTGMRMKGGDDSRIKTVLLLGRGGSLPAVQDILRSRFPEAEVYSGHPLDAVARGAAMYTPTLPTQDRIAMSYALRYWDPADQEHHYRFLVHSGTRYPSAGQVARIIISAAYDGQTHLGIPIYQIGGETGKTMPGIELVSDTSGGVRLAAPVQDADAMGQVLHANAHSPTLLVASPPARKGEPRFECTFTIDQERNICLSARDLVTGALVKLNAAVCRMK